MTDTTTAILDDPSTREMVLAIVPKIAGALSFGSSGWIAFNVLSDKQRRSKTYHQLLACMSLCDMVSSFAYFLSTWPVPQGENLGWKKNSHIWAFGTDATCTAQAVGIQWGVTSAVLNVALSVHYLLVIRYQTPERSLQRYLPYALAVALLVGLGLTIPGIVLGIFGNTNLWCWIAPDFARCEIEGLSRDECVEQAYLYRWAFYYGPLWTCIALITTVQAALLASVYKIENRNTRWSAVHTSRRQRYRTTRRVTAQACWYVGIFYVTWLPYTAIALTGRFFNPDDTFGVLFLVVLFQPLQGFLNLFVYQRHRIFGACCGDAGVVPGPPKRRRQKFASGPTTNNTTTTQTPSSKIFSVNSAAASDDDDDDAAAAAAFDDEDGDNDDSGNPAMTVDKDAAENAAATTNPEAAAVEEGGATEEEEDRHHDESDCLLEEIYGD